MGMFLFARLMKLVLVSPYFVLPVVGVAVCGLHLLVEGVGVGGTSEIRWCGSDYGLLLSICLRIMHVVGWLVIAASFAVLGVVVVVSLPRLCLVW